MQIVYSEGKEKPGMMPRKITFRHMMRDTLWHPVSFIKRELFQKIGVYDEHLKIASDYDFFLKAIFIHKATTFYLNKTVAAFDMNGISSLDVNKNLIAEERKKIQLRYFEKEEIEKALQVSFPEKVKIKIRSFFR
jgi:hypothetical protein